MTVFSIIVDTVVLPEEKFAFHETYEEKPRIPRVRAYLARSESRSFHPRIIQLVKSLFQVVSHPIRFLVTTQSHLSQSFTSFDCFNLKLLETSALITLNSLTNCNPVHHKSPISI